MAHGNIYPADRIDTSLANYFRVGNLAALREIALLWVADRVEESLQEYLEDHGIAAAWETRERVVVALDRRSRRRRADSPCCPHGAASAGRPARRPRPPERRARAAVDGAARAAPASPRRCRRQLPGDHGRRRRPRAWCSSRDAERATQLVLGASRQLAVERHRARVGDRRRCSGQPATSTST